MPERQSGLPLSFVVRLFCMRTASTVSLLLNGLASSDDRRRLKQALEKFVPSYRIEPAVADELSIACRPSTYTELWMDALKSQCVRSREQCLQANDTVCNGTYEVARQIAAGGQAVVYEAVVLNKALVPFACAEVVLKEYILPSDAGLSVRTRVLASIQKEADLLRSLKHPNIVKFLDFFVEDHRAYLVLERVRGETLKALVEKRGAMTEEQVILLSLQMCEILGYLHSSSVIHRDFTPDNLILGHGDILKLIDFNVAQQYESDSARVVVGKHAYIPPEQFRGRADARSDLYAAGCTMHYMLTAVEPEPITQSEPRNIRPDLSSGIAAIVRKATAPELTERYASCVEMRSDLQKLRQCYG